MHQPDFFHFAQKTEIHAGSEALSDLPQVLRRLGVHHPLIITDKGVISAGLMENMQNVLASGAHQAEVISDVPPDSDIRTVRQIAEEYDSLSCDGLIAVGGGSVIDTAKGVNILISLGRDASGNLRKITEFAGAGTIRKPLGPLIVIPTTSGTGSEATLVAVIKDHETRQKMLFTSEHLIPDAAILDPHMTVTLPPHLTASTAMDALSHAVEAYIGLAKNPLSDTAAIQAIDLIRMHLPKALEHPDSLEDRMGLAYASHLAGAAFSNSMVGIVHTIGHSVGAVCGIPHGVCMAILLPYGLEYNFHKISPQLDELLLPLAGTESCHKTPKNERAEAAVQAVRDLNAFLAERTGGKHVLRFRDLVREDGSLMVTPEQLQVIAETGAHDGSLLYNREEIHADDILLVLQAAYWGYPLDRNRVKKGAAESAKKAKKGALA